MNVNDLIISETARMDVYKGLSACYVFPEASLIAQLKKLEQQLLFLNSDAFAPAMLMRSELQLTENIEILKVEFSRLFIGPYRLAAPPYGSIYLEGKRKIMGDSTIDVHKRYIDNGLAISENFKDVPDHIAAELEFMYFLVFKEISAIRSEQLNEGSECLYRQQSFLSDHLGAWVQDFTHDTELGTEFDFYRNLAIATRVYIAEDLEYLSSLKVCQAM